MSGSKLAAERQALTIPEFCARQNFSRATYFNVRRAGLGPVELRIPPNIVRITLEAERDWQRARMNPSGDELADIEQQKAELAARGSRAGRLAAESPRHVSKQKRVRRGAS